MKLEIRTLTLMLCAALMLTTACKKTPIPAEDPEPSVVDFCASSQATWVKTETSTTPQTQSFPYDNFGVWGIARQGSNIYHLWNNASLTDVNINEETGFYEPTTVAYWLSGYIYNFIAVAQCHDEGFSFIGVTTKEEQVSSTPAVQNPVDYVTFTYDMSHKYSASNYVFDLLGAAMENRSVTGGRTEPQNMIFWHLFSQVNIGVSFTTGLNGEQVKGKLTKIKLKNICTEATSKLYYVNNSPSLYAEWICAEDANTMECEYTVSQDVTLTIKANQADAVVTLTAGESTVTGENGEASITVPRGTNVAYTIEGNVGAESKKVQETLYVHRSFKKIVSLETNQSQIEAVPDWSLNVIPQDATKMKLFLDFEIDGQVYNDFEVRLNFPTSANPQVFNHKYNWNISIGTGAAIKFEVVDVVDWKDGEDGEISM